MSRRLLGASGLAASLVLGSGGVLLHPATAAVECVSYPDPVNDTKLDPGEGPPQTDDDGDLDITGLTMNNTASELWAVITVRKLAAAPAKAPGHGFGVTYTFNGKVFQHSFFKYGQASLDTAAAAGEIQWSSRAGGSTISMPVAAAFDLAANTVTLKVKRADLETFGAAPAFGATLTKLSADSSADYVGSAFDYDNAKAPDTAAYTIRYGCGPTVVDPGNPPALPTGPAPDVLPRAGCPPLFTDAKGDGTPTLFAPDAPNEPDLDLLDVTVNTTATQIKAYLHVDKLGDKPANFQGDRFEFLFSTGGKNYTFAVGRVAAPSDEVAADPNRGQVGGTTNAKLKPTGTFTTATNTVVIAIDRAGLDEVHGAPVGYGTVLTGVQAKTFGLQPGVSFAADTAVGAETSTLTVGYSPCFLPPPAKLVATGSTSVQYGDAATLSVKITNEGGAALSGKAITFSLGGRSATRTSNASGVATASIPHTLTAGPTTFSASFAGDAAVGPASIAPPYTVKLEVCKITLAVTKSGAKRTVTATLTDDDKKPVAGQLIDWLVNGKKVASTRTASSGKASYAGAKPGQTVTAVFATVSGKYAGASAKTKLP